MEGSVQGIYQALCLILFYLPGFIIFTLFVYRKIPIWYIVFTHPIEVDNIREMPRELPGPQPVDPKEQRKEELKAKGPQQKPHFLLRLSSSYFKKFDILARWLFGGHPPSQDAEPKTQPEIKSQQKDYITFRNEGEEIPDIHSQGIAKSRQIHTDRLTSENKKISKVIDSSKYIKKTERGQGSIQSDPQRCTICLDAEANAVLMDCGHGAICFECGLALLRTTCECHLCRQPVIQVLKIDTNFIHNELLKVLEAADLYNIIRFTKKTGSNMHTSNV